MKHLIAFSLLVFLPSCAGAFEPQTKAITAAAEKLALSQQALADLQDEVQADGVATEAELVQLEVATNEVKESRAALDDAEAALTSASSEVGKLFGVGGGVIGTGVGLLVGAYALYARTKALAASKPVVPGTAKG